MLSDTINNSHRYPYGPAWDAAFAYIRQLTPETATGKHLIMGDQMFAGIDAYETKNRAMAKLETHRKYVDIQLLLSGEEIIDVYPKAGLKVAQPYNPERDAEFYQVPEETPVSVRLSPGHFLVFFPDDAHMPCVSVGPTPQPVKKVVIKIALELLFSSP